jgi:hypothetical protein
MLNIVDSLRIENERNPNMESLYDYGSRSGFWRYHRLFTSRKLPVTVFAVGMVRYFCAGASVSTATAIVVANIHVLPVFVATCRRWNAIQRYVTH